MGRWIAKATIQGALSLLPDPQRWNRLLQTYVTGSIQMSDDQFLTRWRHAERHVEDWENHHGAFAGTSVLELGTGWLPIVPLVMVLNGARRVVSVDLQDLLTDKCAVATLVRIEALISSGVVQVRGPDAHSRLRAVLQTAPSRRGRELLSDLGITCILGDARQLDLPAGSIDLFVSNNTFEHIPGDILTGILREFARLASPRALGSHFVDMVDHYAQFDRTLSVYNFLRYSDLSWRLINNRLQYQNRLRLPDFRAIHRAAGWNVVSETNTTGPAGELEAMTVAPRFRAIPTADLAVTTSWLVSSPTPTATASAVSTAAANTAPAHALVPEPAV